MPRRVGTRKGNHGGRRAGAGRPRKVHNQSPTIKGEAKAIKDFAKRNNGMLPLDHMLSVMRDPEVKDERRDAMARAAAPYFHPRLSALDVRSNAKPTRNSIDLRKLTDEQLLQLEQIVAVAGQVIDEEGTPQEDVPVGYMPVVSGKLNG